MFNLFKRQKGTGALIDTRPQEEREKDFKFEEIVASADPVNWVEKTQSEWRKFPIFDQNGSNACVAFSLSKILGIMHQVNEGEWIDFSPGFIYQQRANKPGSGMGGVDAWEIVRKNGALLDVFFPSQGKNDDYLDSYQVKDYERQIASIFKISNYVVLPIKDIDTIASTIQKTGKAVMVWYWWNYDEWDINVPTIKYPDLIKETAAGRHSVSAVDFTLYQGKKALIIEDSWGKNYGINGQRIITEDFHSQRNFFAAYPINFQFEVSTTVKPSYTFNNDLKYGMTNNSEVKILQDALKYFGFFPINTDSTGNYFGLTAKAVYNWQVKYQVAPIEELNVLQGKVFGPASRAKMNELLNDNSHN